MRERRRKGKRNCNDESNEKKRIARRMEIYIYRTSHAEREREREKHIHSRNLCARLLSINLIVTRFEPSSSVSALPRCACARMRARVCLAFIVYCALASCTHDFDPPPRTFKKPVRLDPHITPVKS